MFVCLTSLGFANGNQTVRKFIFRKHVFLKRVKTKVGGKRGIQGPANLQKEDFANMETIVGLIIDHQST